MDFKAGQKLAKINKLPVTAGHNNEEPKSDQGSAAGVNLQSLPKLLADWWIIDD